MSIFGRIGAALPALDPLARATDAARMKLVDEVLAEHAALVEETRTLAADPEDAVERLDEIARHLLGALRGTGPFEAFDAWVRSDLPEILDAPDVNARTRRRAMKRLEALNDQSGAHVLFANAIERALGDGDAPHVYEVAAGTGGLARHAGPLLLATRPGLRWTISDLDEAGLGASDRDPPWLAAEGRNALALSELDDVDLFVCAQAAHHLPPGVVVGMLGQAARAPRGVLILDVHRGGLVATLAGTAGVLLGRNRIVAIDGVRSARRAFTPAELALLARLAGLRVLRAGPLGPAYAVLHAVA